MTQPESLDIAIVGGGPGGFAAALALTQVGHHVTVYERAKTLARVGADVNLTPNVVRALDGLGVGDELRARSARPKYRISRTWDSGEETSRLPMSDAAEERYGSPQLTIHRGDLIEVLADALDASTLRLGAPVSGIDPSGDRPTITVAGGEHVSADVVVAADGIHSLIRNELFGVDDPRYTGLVSYRSVFPTEWVDVANLDSFTKWWGPTSDEQVVVFPLSAGTETFVFATSRQDDWEDESWTSPGDPEELQALFADWHPDVIALMSAVDDVMKSALHVREPMPTWNWDRVTLLGDAAHPMTPFMAQGAGMAIEDAVVFARSVQDVDADAVPSALGRYEAARRPRTAQVQRESSANEWMRNQQNADWLYGYDAWTVPLGQGETAQ